MNFYISDNDYWTLRIALTVAIDTADSDKEAKSYVAMRDRLDTEYGRVF